MKRKHTSGRGYRNKIEHKKHTCMDIKSIVFTDAGLDVTAADDTVKSFVAADGPVVTDFSDTSVTVTHKDGTVQTFNA